MSDRFINIGIDHGTTNSAVAVMTADGPRVLPPDTGAQEETMPSVVFMDRQRREMVGSAARQAMFFSHESEGKGFTGYKLRIGSDDRFDFKAAGCALTAPEMGSRIIRQLLIAYQRHHNVADLPSACVVTVPAKFNQAQFDGTRKAAELAGLKHVVLPQEPVAAALAYGLNTKDKKAQWVIFDLGGGTLDVSLVTVRKGQLIVPDEGHMGDAELGGRIFDRDLFDYVLGPAKDNKTLWERYRHLDPDYKPLRATYSLENFSEKSAPGAAARLLYAVEEAKIALSNHAEAIVDVPGVLCQDESGKDVKVEVHITRSAYEQVIICYVDRALHCCRSVLSRNRLKPQDIDKLVLVGGPTLTPFIRTRLADTLGIPLDTSMNPMTAVALGAAIQAATEEVPAALRIRRKSKEEKASLRLSYEPSSRFPDVELAGVVSDVQKPDSCTVEIVRTDGQWASGPVPVGQDGSFTAELLLIQNDSPTLSEFRSTVRGPDGSVLAVLDEPTIWFPFPDTEGAVKQANTLLVEIENNGTFAMIPQGSPLTPDPAVGVHEFRTTKAIKRGSKDDVLRIQVREQIETALGGTVAAADCNAMVGPIVICGDDPRITSDIPADTTVEVRVTSDASRNVSVLARIPLLQEEFEAQFSSAECHLKAEDISTRMELIKVRLAQCQKILAAQPNPHAGQMLDQLEMSGYVMQIDKDLQRGQDGDREALRRAYMSMLKLAGAIIEVETVQRKDRIVAKLGRVKPLCNEPTEHEQLQTIEAELGAANPEDPAGLARIEDRVNKLDFHAREQPFLRACMALACHQQVTLPNAQIALLKEVETKVLAILARGGAETITEPEVVELENLMQRVAREVDGFTDRFNRFLTENGKRFANMSPDVILRA